MTGKRGGLEPAARKLILCVLFGSALFILWSCEGVGPKPNAPAPVTTATPDPTEAQLLAELDKKWENPQVHLELARLYHKGQNWTKAEWYYSNALGFDPANKGAQAGQVKLFLDRGDAAKAEQFANGYIRTSGVLGARDVAAGMGVPAGQPRRLCVALLPAGPGCRSEFVRSQ